MIDDVQLPIGDDDKFLFGRAAYEYYIHSEPFRSSPMLRWEELPIHIQLAWVGAALDVIKHVRTVIKTSGLVLITGEKKVEITYNDYD